MSPTALETLAAFVCETPPARTPDAMKARIRLAFLDTMGCLLAGSGAPSALAAGRAAASWGAGSAPLFGTGAALAPPWAALANGAAAHAFDFDDYTLQANDHPSAVMVPALLAAAEPLGPELPGDALLDAYAIGLETIFRLGEAVNMGHYNLGWHTTSTLDGFGAAAAVARLWGLSPRETVTALSLTASVSSGAVSQFGSDAKPLHAGFSAKAAIVSASLAREGAAAYAGALDGPVSFASLMTPDGRADFAGPFAKLGAPWGMEEFGLGAKAYASCGYTHRIIDAALEARHRLAIETSDVIAHAALSVPPHFRAVLRFHTPRDRTEALFSAPYCAAAALTTGRCGLEAFTDAAVEREDVLALTGRIVMEERTPLRPEINLDRDDPDWVRVVLQDGRALTTTAGLWTGAPGRDLSEADFRAKFAECLAAAETLAGPGYRPPRDPARLEEALLSLGAAPGLASLKAAF